MTESSRRVGILGSGFMGRTWAEVTARHLPGGRLVAVAGGRRAPQLAKDYECALEAGLEELLSRPDIEVVILTTPPAGHADQALAAAAAGKHVLIEKPMAQNVAECRKMIAAFAAAGTKLAIVSQHRFRAAPLAARKVIDEGTIGDLSMMRVMGPDTGWWDVTKTQDEWKLDPAQQTAFASWGAHACDLMRWFAGSDATLAFAQFAHYSAEPPPGRSAMVTYRFGSGVMSQAWMSYDIPQPGLGSALQLLLTGTRGMIDLDAYGRVRVGSGEGWEVVYEQPDFDPLDPVSVGRLAAYVGELTDLMDAIERGGEPQVNGREGLLTTAMLEAAELSASVDQAVRIDSEGALILAGQTS